MRHPFSVACLVIAGWALGACTEPTSSAADGGAPSPTIGLGSDIVDGEISGGATVRSVGFTQIDTVVMIGDSITVASTPALEEMFARLGFENVLVQAEESKRTAVSTNSNPSGAAIADNLISLIESADAQGDGAGDDPLDHSNELWVVALGTNDIAQYSNPAERAAAVNEMLNAVPAESPLIWVDTYIRDRLESTAEMNDIIVDRVEQRGNSAIARWSAVAEDDGNLRDDGVHPREAGSVVFADTVGAAIADFFELT